MTAYGRKSVALPCNTSLIVMVGNLSKVLGAAGFISAIDFPKGAS